MKAELPWGKKCRGMKGGDMHTGEARKRMKESIARRQKSW